MPEMPAWLPEMLGVSWEEAEEQWQDYCRDIEEDCP